MDLSPPKKSPLDIQANHPMDHEEAQKLLQRLSIVPETSGHLRKTLGSQNVAEYFQIVGSVEVVEMDWYSLTGQLSREQIAQYNALSGEYELTMDKLARLAEKISVQFIPLLPELVQRDQSGRGEKAGLLNLLQSIEKLGNSMPAELAGTVCYRQFLGVMLQRMLFGLLGAELIRIELSAENKALGEAIHKFLRLVDDITMAREGMQFPGIQVHNELVFYRDSLFNEENLRALDRIIGMEGRPPLTEAKKQAYMAENLANLSDIRREASYKKILLHTLHERGPQIIVHGDDMLEEHEGGRYAEFCTFRINFDPRLKLGLPKTGKDKFGNRYYDYSNLPGVVNFTLNPVTGELRLITNPMITLAAVLDPERYLLLKHCLLIQLKEYLQAKEPDIEDLFLPSPTETLQSERADVHEQIVGHMKEDSPVHPDQTIVDPAWKYEPYTPSAHQAAAVGGADRQKPWESVSTPPETSSRRCQNICER